MHQYSVLKIQEALQVVAALNLTAGWFPDQSYVQDGDNFDFIIAGGGTAGCVLANRLTEDENNKVLLIEAGGDPPIETEYPGMLPYLMNTRYDWNYTMKTNDYKCGKNQYIHPGSGMLLGGSSSINYMNYGRGGPSDYQVWADAAKDNSWLWNDIQSYYIKAEGIDPAILNSAGKKIHGTDGPLKLTRQKSKVVDKYIEALKEIGREEWDLNTNQFNGYYHLVLTYADCKRQSTAYSYLRLAKDRPNLYVLKNTLVTKIIIDKNKKATGVKVVAENNKMMRIYAKKEVILSAGVFNSPQILMLSGIGPKEYLLSKEIKVVSDLPVGENLQDNVAVMIIHKTGQIKSVTSTNQCDIQAGLLGGLVALNKSSTSAYKTVSFITDKEEALLGLSSKRSYDFLQSTVKKIAKLCEGREVMLTMISDVKSRTRGRVLLNTTNPKDNPLLNYNFSTSNDELELLRTYVEDFLKIENSTLFKNLGAEMINPVSSKCKGLKRGTKDYWRCYIKNFKIPLFHFTGTCALGSVVDNRLYVYGVKGLRVVDASIMPIPPSATSYGPTVMVAEKASDMIKEDYK